MILSRLKTCFTSQALFFFLFLGLSGSACFAGEGIAPEKNISIVLGEPGSPQWKDLWDTARNLARDGKYSLAATAYSDLYKLKPNIEEANWEFSKVLLKVEDFSKAAKIINSLLEKDPNNSEYLLVGADVAMHWKNYNMATRYYGRVFEKDPTGIHSDDALLGLATSLRNSGKKELAFALLEQYSLRYPENSEVVQQLGQDAHALGKNKKAERLYTRLLENPTVDDQVILQAVQVFDVPGYENKRSTLWLEYLKRHPDYIPFRQDIAAYYMESGDYEGALLHLTYLADNAEDNDKYLLDAGKICLENLDRPDKALFFYEKYREKHPDNDDVKQQIGKIQSILAHDFLPIVENGGALQLWKDLAEITSNRVAIYLEVADILEKNNQTKVLIEVLEIVYNNSSPIDAIALRIAQNSYRLSEYSKALKYLKSVTGTSSKTKAFYLLKGDTEQHLGLEMHALESFEEGLIFDPLDISLRIKCLELAGEIGNAVELQTLFDTGLKQITKEDSPDLVFIYLDLLSYNFLFHEYEKIHHWAKDFFSYSPETVTKLDLHLARTLQKEGRTRRAEQLLRQLLNKGILVEDILFQLAEKALAEKKPAAAENWYKALQKDISHPTKFSFDSFGCRMVLLKVDLLKAQGKYRAAQTLIENYLAESEMTEPSQEFQALRVRLESRHCWLSFYDGQILDADKQSRKLLRDGTFEPDLFVLQGIIAGRLNRNYQEIESENGIKIAGNFVLSRLLAVVEIEIQYVEYDAAERHLAAVLDSYPASVAGNLMWAELMIARGRGDSATNSLSHLISQFPEEPYYQKKQIEVERRRGRYRQGLTLMNNLVGVDNRTDKLVFHLSPTENMEELLTLARLLWGDKQQERALDIYRQLLARPVLDMLSEEFKQKQVDHPYLTREDTIWTSIMLMLQSEPELLAELMEPPFLIDNRGKEAGIIVSDFYEQYSWQKLITNEYMARKAIFEKNYYYAEQSYKRLLEEDSSEGMMDLATIYAKIGKYRKEAQVYEAMQSSGKTSPDLVESIERNTLQISPQSIFNAAYEEKSGRDGNIDLARTTIGTSFWITPDLDKDIRLTYANNRFESLDTDVSTGSNYLYAVATYEFTKAYELVIGAGTEKLNGDSDTGYQYEMEVKGQLDDYVNAYMLVEKRQVYDTVAAIKQQVTYQAIETGLNIETPIGLSLGGDLAHRYYNDDNSQNRFQVYSGYSMFKETIELALRYKFQYLTSDDEKLSQSTIFGTGSSDDPVYWSPSSFTEHRLTLHFQHDFLGYELGNQKSMSYYSIDNAIGFEDNENFTFSTNLNIFLEMSPRFLLKGNFILSKSDEYEEKGLSMSLHYRW
ncbi:MAG: tetratricopeptide repeat protein [Desulforhopalus sp.]